MVVRILLFCSTEHGMHTRPRREAVNANEYAERRGAKSQGYEAEPNAAQQRFSRASATPQPHAKPTLVCLLYADVEG